MFFTVVPFLDIGKNSFRISDHYLGKDKQKNSLISWAWKIAYHKTIMNGEFLDDSLPKNELRKIYNKVQRGKIQVIENWYLNKEGKLLLHNIFDRLGCFKFSIYEDDKEPATTIQFIDINNIKELLLLSFDVTLLVSTEDDLVRNNIPLYQF